MPGRPDVICEQLLLLLYCIKLERLLCDDEHDLLAIAKFSIVLRRNIDCSSVCQSKYTYIAQYFASESEVRDGNTLNRLPVFWHTCGKIICIKVLKYIWQIAVNLQLHNNEFQTEGRERILALKAFADNVSGIRDKESNQLSAIAMCAPVCSPGDR